MSRIAMRHSDLRLTRALALGLLIALCAACAPSDATPDAAPQAGADRLARLYADEASWPTRVWLEEPLVEAGGEVLVPPHRNGVLITMHRNGDLRVDFGRHGAHTVPIAQTNFVAEAARYRSGEATKTFPNLLAMMMNKLVEIDAERLRPLKVDGAAVRGGRILLMLADARTADVAALARFASEVEAAGDVRLTVFVPITDELDGDVLGDLNAGGWTAPFVMTPIAQSYVKAMLEPGMPQPFARLATDEGRILAEGPPDDATFAAMRSALGG